MFALFLLLFLEPFGFAQVPGAAVFPEGEDGWEHLSLDEHLNVVYALQRSGRYEAASKRLFFLLHREEYQDSRLFIQFEYAKNAEYQEEYQIALSVYDNLFLEKLPSDLKLNVLYRYSIMLMELNDPKGAIKIAKKIRRSRILSSSDRRAVSLILGTAQLQAGKKKKGIRRIQKTFGKLVSPQEHAWLQARAKMALAEELLFQAEQIELFTVEEIEDSLKIRANLIIQAERQVQSIIALNEPEYALSGLSRVADSMLVLYDDLLASQPPSEFTKEQKELYKEAMDEKADFLQEKALSYYSTALRYANQIEWSGKIRGELQAKYDALQQEI